MVLMPNFLMMTLITNSVPIYFTWWAKCDFEETGGLSAIILKEIIMNPTTNKKIEAKDLLKEKVLQLQIFFMIRLFYAF